VLTAGAYGGWRWSQTQYFVAESGGVVAVYRGLPQDLGPIDLSSVVERTTISVADLPQFTRDKLGESIVVDGRDQADAVVADMRTQAERRGG
jgi:PPM family protein phosphatase